MPGWLKRLKEDFVVQPGGPGAARYGRVAIPGEAAIDLPAGLVRVYYEVDEGGSGALVHAPKALVIRVYGPDGRDVPIQPKPKHTQAVSRGFGGAGRSYVGKLAVELAGTHAVTTELDGELLVPARICLGD
jgi:hypothetical protein